MNENYRSKQNLVTFSNQFVQNIPNRLKEFPIIAHQNDSGNIKILTYQNGNLIKPLVGEILNTDLSGTTCVLTQTNEEALQITGLLLKNNLKAKLIQTNDGFNLYNLDEVRFFINQLNLDEGIYIIQDEVWNKAKQALFIRYGNSLQYEVAANVMKEFEAANPNKKYKSDLLVLIRESKLEDFYADNGEVIYVSTIHKAKGKEFDNVFIMLNKMDNISNEYYRLLYVAITRAKSNLSIHTKGNYFQLINTENVARIYDDNQHQLPNELVMQLSFKDVWLGYFNHKQNNIDELKSGDTLVINGRECFDAQRNSILKFSKQFMSKIESIESKGFKMNGAKINFIVFWYNEELDKEIKILLPEITFKKIIV